MSLRHRPRLLALASGLAVVVAGLTLDPSPAAALGSPGSLDATFPSGSAIPILTWHRVEGATSYDVQVATTPTFSAADITASVTNTVNDTYVPTAQLPAGQLYFRVRGDSGTTTGAWSEASPFRRPALDPPQIQPVDLDGDGIDPVETAVLRWSPVLGARSYTVQISTDALFPASGATTTATVATTSFAASTLKVPTTYYWRVQAQLANGVNTDFSETGSYTLNGLAKPLRVSPADGEVVQDVELEWDPVHGAATYDLQVSTDEEFKNSAAQVDSQSGLIATRYAPATTYNNDQYYWRVRPVDAAGNKLDWSQVDVWRFQRSWPDQSTLVHPAMNAIETGSSSSPFYYQWTGVPRASRYELQLSSTSDFSQVDQSCGTVQTTYTPFSSGRGCMPSPGVRTYWRVLAYDDGPSSRSDSLVTQAIHAPVSAFTYDPGLVRLTAPVDGDPAVSLPILQWEPVAHAATYQVTITPQGGSPQTVTTAATSYVFRSMLTPGQTYTWYVQTVSPDHRVGPAPVVSARWSFTAAAAPAGTAASPEPLTIAPSPRFPTLRWTPVAGATNYKVLIRRQGSTSFTYLGSTFSYAAGDDIGTTYAVPGVYEWFVEAYDSTHLIAQGSLGSFTISDQPPVSNYRVALDGDGFDGAKIGQTDGDGNPLPPTYCGEPTTDCQNLRQTPVLAWDAPSDTVAYYKLYVSKDAEMTNVVSGYNGITVYGNIWAGVNTLPDSQAGSAYWWEVLPCNAVCAPLKEATHAFNKLSTGVLLTAPASWTNSPMTAVDDNVKLTWSDYLASESTPNPPGVAATTPLVTTAQTEAKYYVVDWSTDPNFQTVSSYSVDQPFLTLPRDTFPDGPVYWRVHAMDGSDNPLASSSARPIEVKGGPGTPEVEVGMFARQSTGPTLVTGASGNITQDQQLGWKAVPYARSYDVEIYKNGDTNASSVNRVVATNTPQVAYTATSALPVSSAAYVWRVRRVDAAGRKGAWSTWGSFHVVGTAPAPQSPADGATHVAPTDVVYSWSATQGAVSYRVERRAPGAATVTGSTTTPALAYASTGAVPDGTWQWRVSSLDTNGNTIGTSSWQTFSVADHPVALSAPKVQGNAVVGSTLRATAPVWDLTGVTNTYQWMRGTTRITGATSQVYALQTADVGAKVTVVVTGHLAGFHDGIATSAALTCGPRPSLVLRSAPKVSGVTRVGGTLSSSAGTWSAPAVVTYQWLRAGVPIAGATRASYAVVAADAGRRLSARVTATASGYAAGSATTAAVTIAKLATTTAVRLSATRIRKRARASVAVTVTAPGLSRPTGTLQVFDGARRLKRVALRAQSAGRVALRLPRLAVGRHRISVRYSGSAATLASTSRKVVLKVTR